MTRCVPTSPSRNCCNIKHNSAFAPTFPSLVRQIHELHYSSPKDSGHKPLHKATVLSVRPLYVEHSAGTTVAGACQSSWLARVWRVEGGILMKSQFPRNSCFGLDHKVHKKRKKKEREKSVFSWLRAKNNAVVVDSGKPGLFAVQTTPPKI